MSEVLQIARDMFGLIVNKDCLPAVYYEDTDTVALIKGPVQFDTVCSERVSSAKAEFNKLAGLDGNPESLSRKDLEILRNHEVLAEFIKNHPAFKAICDKPRDNIVLRMGRRSADSVGGVDYRRFIYYIQLALNRVIPTKYQIKNPNGSYGQETARAIEKFQKMINLKDDRNGTIAGRVTIINLLRHVKYTKQRLIEELRRAQSDLQTLSNDEYVTLEDDCDTTICTTAHKIIVEAMLWLGWTKTLSRNIAQEMVQKKWEKQHVGDDARSLKIGPKFVKWLIRNVEETKFQ